MKKQKFRVRTEGNKPKFGKARLKTKRRNPFCPSKLDLTAKQLLDLQKLQGWAKILDGVLMVFGSDLFDKAKTISNLHFDATSTFTPIVTPIDIKSEPTKK